MKILVAEDDAVTRSRLERMLTKWGFEVILTVDGNEAWKALKKKNSPKLILLDWMMPGIEGLEICKRLRAIESDDPAYIILLTGRTNKKDIVQGLEAGADDYIPKPFEDSELHARINAGCRSIEFHDILIEKERLQGVLETAGAVCHEMNQPLQAISGISELLLLDYSESDPIYKKIYNIKELTDRMGSITKKLMRITKYETKELLRARIIDIDKATVSNK
jgi:DNA-binding response OmpR family regulator